MDANLVPSIRRPGPLRWKGCGLAVNQGESCPVLVCRRRRSGVFRCRILHPKKQSMQFSALVRGCTGVANCRLQFIPGRTQLCALATNRQDSRVTTAAKAPQLLAADGWLDSLQRWHELCLRNSMPFCSSESVSLCTAPPFRRRFNASKRPPRVEPARKVCFNRALAE